MSELWLPDIHALSRAFVRLSSHETHRLFPGYLCVQFAAAQTQRLDGLRPEFLRFFQHFFSVPDHPLGTPYLIPFTKQRASPKNLWLNENVAGTYAPSSLRAGQPFTKVVEVDRATKTYSLPDDHARRALRELLNSAPIAAADIALFLYRDYALIGSKPSVRDLVEIFAYEFGYTREPGATPSDDFHTLFDSTSIDEMELEWDVVDPDEPVLIEPQAPFHPTLISPVRSHSPMRHVTAAELFSPEKSGVGSALPLQHLVVQGLLSFGETTEFDFGRLNILVGPNGSGKSNMIDCLRVFRYAPTDIQDTFSDVSFGEWLFKGNASTQGYIKLISQPHMVSHPLRHELRLVARRGRAVLEELIQDDLPSEHIEPYFVGSERSQPTLSIASSRSRRKLRPLDRGDYDSTQSIVAQLRDVQQYPEISRLASLYSGIRIYSEWTFGRGSPLRDPSPSGRTGSFLSEGMDDLAAVLDRLLGTQTHDRIREVLRDVKESYLDFITRQLVSRIVLDLKESPFETLVPANRLSDGTLRFLAMAVILLHPDPPPVICIEEPELGMHPDMITIVARMLVEASAKTQLIVSTHSEHLLSALQGDFDVLFAFDASDTGTVVRRFSQADYSDWRESHALGELWSSGELGGNRW